MTSTAAGRLVWLASFPKSGNTWMRAIVSALATHPHLFAVNHLGSAGQPFVLTGALSRFGLDTRWLDDDELARVRTSMLTAHLTRDDQDIDSGIGDGLDDAGLGGPGGEAGHMPRLRKTHEVHRCGPPGREPFPPAATRAAILVVRDPRDVACSYAPFFGVDIDTAIDQMAIDRPTGPRSAALGLTEQPWGSWSSHTASWLADDVPFPVHLVRYEDLRRDAVETLLPVFDAIGLACTEDELRAAVEQTRFDRLRESETERGFRETSRRTERFFRKGESGAWRDELTPEQVAAIEADHADTMTRLGYALTTDDGSRSALAEARRSERRRRGNRLRLPAHLGIEVELGDVPTQLTDGVQVTPWVQTTPNATLVRFDADGRARMLVEDGRRVTVSWPDVVEGDDDPSWVLQGWAVMICALQRGGLCLHASTLEIGDQVVAIAGRQGAGKSTTSMELRRRGHRILMDDTTVVDVRDGGVWTTPFGRNVHLLPDTAAAVGVEFGALPLLAGGRRKAAFRPEDPPSEPRRIDRIVVLTPTARVESPTGADVAGTDRVSLLRRHTIRRGLATAILGEQRFFDQLTRLADATVVQQLRRPIDGWSLDEVADLVERGSRPQSDDDRTGR